MAKLPLMFMRLFLGGVLLCAATLRAQSSSAQVELANLREDVRGLVQRIGELSLRVEQLERENYDLRGATSAASQNYATVAQLNSAVADLSQVIKSATEQSKGEVLQQVSTQIKELARQTNAALDSVTKAAPAAASVRTPSPARAESTPASTLAAPAVFSEKYPKEGINYTVQLGDTVALIAKKKDARLQDIINANKLADPSRIQPGQTLFIPLGK